MTDAPAANCKISSRPSLFGAQSPGESADQSVGLQHSPFGAPTRSARSVRHRGGSAMDQESTARTWRLQAHASPRVHALEFRLETFNTFNHAQSEGANSSTETSTHLRPHPQSQPGRIAQELRRTCRSISLHSATPQHFASPDFRSNRAVV